MMTENIQALVTYRLEQAEESLEAARTLLDKKLIRPSVKRAYYAMFYAVLALLARGWFFSYFLIGLSQILTLSVFSKPETISMLTPSDSPV